MLDAIREALKLREERITVGGVKLLVREVTSAAEFAEMPREDFGYQLVVKCVLDEAGAPVFTAEDIPALKNGSRAALLPLFVAVNRVNGLDAAENAKNSDAVPS